jgi:hypothetical protein
MPIFFNSSRGNALRGGSAISIKHHSAARLRQPDWSRKHLHPNLSTELVSLTGDKRMNFQHALGSRECPVA